MKRFLNEVRSLAVEAVDGNHSLKFKLVSTPTPALADRELIIGTNDGKKYLLVNISNELYSISHDDFMYNFLKQEREYLETNFGAITFPGSITFPATHSNKISADRRP